MPIKMNQAPARNKQKFVRGFALLEILLATTLIGVGLFAGLRLLIHNNTLHQQMTQQLYAQMISADLMRKMDALGIFSRHAAVAFGAFPSAPDCWKQNCSESELGNFFVQQWKCAFSHWHNKAPCQHSAARFFLPASDGKIELAGTTINIHLVWNKGTPLERTLTLPFTPLLSLSRT